jgi:hypothetical protein
MTVTTLKRKPRAAAEPVKSTLWIPPSARLKTKHAADPRPTILDAVGELEDLELFHNRVLVYVYKRPNEATLGGKTFFLADKTVGEDEFQGIVGLVLKKGPAAFKDDDRNNFYGCNVERGDWVFFRASDGIRMLVNGQLCRRIEDVHIEGRIPHPDYVY